MSKNLNSYTQEKKKHTIEINREKKIHTIKINREKIGLFSKGKKQKTKLLSNVRADIRCNLELGMGYDNELNVVTIFEFTLTAPLIQVTILISSNILWCIRDKD